MSRLKARSVLALALTLGLALALAGCGSGSDSPTAPADLPTSAVEAQSFNLVNNARQNEAVDPELAQDGLLTEIARAHSEAMRDQGFFSHTSPQGQSLRDRLRTAGVAFRTAGENLAQVQGGVDPAGDAHRLLMQSASHRSNILSPKYSMLGVGVAKSGDTYWVTQVYLEP